MAGVVASAQRAVVPVGETLPRSEGGQHRILGPNRRAEVTPEGPAKIRVAVEANKSLEANSGDFDFRLSDFCPQTRRPYRDLARRIKYRGAIEGSTRYGGCHKYRRTGN